MKRSLKKLFSASRENIESRIAIQTELYSDKDAFDAEVECIIRPNWVNVARVSQLSEIGDYISTSIFGQKVLVLKGSDGEIRAVAPVCLHRSTLLLEGSGNCNSIVCPIHRWEYDLAGNLIEKNSSDTAEQKERPCLTRYKVEIWCGWVFVNLDGDAVPMRESHFTLARQLEPWDIESLVPLCEPIKFEGRFNWKILCDNVGDPSHIIGVHATSLPALPHSAFRFESDQESYSLSKIPQPVRVDVREFGEFSFNRLPPGFSGTHMYHVFPLLFIGLTADFVVWQFLEVLDEHSCKMELHVLGREGVLSSSKFEKEIDYFRASIQEIEQEDQLAYALMHEGMKHKSSKAGILTDLEEGSLVWQRWYLNSMSKGSVKIAS